MLPINNKIPLIISTLLITLLYAASAVSLEVGELSIDSALGEPFKANFSVQHPQPLNDQELIIRQAPLEIYQQMGVDSAMLYQDLRFTLMDNGQVQVKSRAPIKEPFLNFVVQFLWSEGEMVREFTVLLDPS